MYNKLYLGDCIQVLKSFTENSIDCECPVCGKLFKRYKCHVKSKYIFCSRNCAYKGRSLGYVKRVVTKPYNCYRKSKRKCLICGNEYVYRKTTQKYCCRKCFEVAHKMDMVGKNNPSFIDGRSYNKRGFRGLEWNKIRKKVFKRDNYTCQECKVRCIGRRDLRKSNSNRLIQCHHIDNNKENNSLENLVTLCVSCHSKIERGDENGILC